MSKSHWPFVVVRGVCLLGLLALATLSPSAALATPGGPGTRPAGLLPEAAQSVESIVPFFVDTGQIGMSIDALGTLSTTGVVTIDKPAGATVRAAYLLAATTGFGYFNLGPLADGAVWLDGYPVGWRLTTESSIRSYNHLADVTGLVSLKFDLAPAGPVQFSIYENDSYRIDGEVLVVIYADPGAAPNTTVALLFGAQNVDGDSFQLAFAEPLDLDDPDLQLGMALGISYGAQGCTDGQYSHVTVNGQRLSSSAGGEDDGACENGALMTAGGVGDLPANPVNPYQVATRDPRLDDELYDLRPFAADGDTHITVDTLNPSRDDNIFLAAFQLSSPAAVSSGPERPVIFIPGFMGSILNEGDEEIWPAPLRLQNTNGDLHLDALILTEDGLDPQLSNISVGDDIVRRVALSDFYGNAINRLEDLGYTEGVDLFVFPYDFRKDIRSTAELLETYIRDNIGTGFGEVDLIAHSQGGLVTKQCVLTSSCAELVNSVAILGTPFAGTPFGLKVLHYGARVPDEGLGALFGVDSDRARIITQNWPNVYQLIPGPNYYALYGQGYFIYDRDLDGDGDNEGRLGYDAAKTFMSDRHNAGLVARGEEFQQDDGIADWQDGTNGVTVVIFAGTGLPTLTEIREYEWRLGPIHTIRRDFREMATGDETVPAFSVALNNRQGVDFTGGNVSVFYRHLVTHGNLPKDPTLLQYIVTIFANTPQRTSAAPAPEAPASPAELPPPPEGVLAEPTLVNGRQFLFTGAVDVEIYDQDGNRTGPGQDDELEVNAAGVSFKQIGDATSVFVYGDGVYTLTVKAQQEGLFSLAARTVDEGQENRQVLFAAVPLSDTVAQAQLLYDTDQAQPDDLLQVDQDGDGNFEDTVAPSGDVAGPALADAEPPQTAIALQGQQLNGRYLGCVQVTLTAADEPGGSGVAEILYTLNDGLTPIAYDAPFLVCAPGPTEIQALAIDQAGNIAPTPTAASLVILHGAYLPLVLR